MKTLRPVSLLTLALAIGLCRTSLSRCPDGHYRDRRSSSHGHECRACSTCPVNQIIRRPCLEDSDTLCGPFSEFSEFNQAGRGMWGPPGVGDDDDPPLDDAEEGAPGERRPGDTRVSDDNRSKTVYDGFSTRGGGGGGGDPDQPHHPKHKHPHPHPHHKDAKWPLKGQAQPEVEALPGGGRMNTNTSPDWKVGSRSGPGGRPEAPSLQDPQEGENQWKVLALALTVVLCVICIFLIVFVFVICYMRSRRAHLKQVLYSSAPSRNFRWSHGAAPPDFTQKLDSSYLYSEEYDADNSGQTISTTKSSDYVYFKSPQNSNDVVDV
ncbi:hypothetical protein ACOMHN_051270 [Nucella lapillus]